MLDNLLGGPVLRQPVAMPSRRSKCLKNKSGSQKYQAQKSERNALPSECMLSMILNSLDIFSLQPNDLLYHLTHS